ncbi:unnamed protein product [Urochloa humidicola]
MLQEGTASVPSLQLRGRRPCSRHARPHAGPSHLHHHGDRREVAVGRRRGWAPRPTALLAPSRSGRTSSVSRLQIRRLPHASSAAPLGSSSRAACWRSANQIQLPPIAPRRPRTPAWTPLLSCSPHRGFSSAPWLRIRLGHRTEASAACRAARLGHRTAGAAPAMVDGPAPPTRPPMGSGDRAPPPRPTHGPLAVAASTLGSSPPDPAPAGPASAQSPSSIRWPRRAPVPRAPDPMTRRAPVPRAPDPVASPAAVPAPPHPAPP